MIGDVLKAKGKLKKLLGDDGVKKLSARIEKAESQDLTASKLIESMYKILGDSAYTELSEGFPKLQEAVKLLSNKPHTTGSSNFKRLVMPNVCDNGFEACLSKINDKEILADSDIQFLKKAKQDIDKYLKRTDLKVKKFKTLGEKMNSLLLANRLKAGVSALVYCFIDDYVETKCKKNICFKIRDLCFGDEINKINDDVGNIRSMSVGKLIISSPTYKKLDGAFADKMRGIDKWGGKANDMLLKRDKLKKVSIEELIGDLKTVRNLLEEWKGVAEEIKKLVPEEEKRIAQEEAERIAQEEAERKAQEEEEAERIAQEEESERKAQEEETKRKAQEEESKRKAQEEAKKNQKFAEKLERVENGEETADEFLQLSEEIRKNLTKLVVPRGVKEIPQDYFKDAKKLKSVSIPDTVETIGYYAFRGCTSLNSVILGKGIKKIQDLAFKECYGLVTVLLPNGLKEIGMSAFENCTNLQRINIPASVSKIKMEAFKECKMLSEITIPRSVEKIESQTFYGCSSLTKLVIQDGVGNIGYAAFARCENLKEVTIPGSVKKIEGSAFHICDSLCKIVIKEGVEEIGHDAFTSNKRRPSVQIEIPKSVKTIDDEGWTKSFSLKAENVSVTGSASEEIKRKIEAQAGSYIPQADYYDGLSGFLSDVEKHNNCSEDEIMRFNFLFPGGVAWGNVVKESKLRSREAWELLRGRLDKYRTRIIEKFVGKNQKAEVTKDVQIALNTLNDLIDTIGAL